MSDAVLVGVEPWFMKVGGNCWGHIQQGKRLVVVLEKRDSSYP